MVIVVDGYNVLKKVVHAGDISERQRANFLKILASYARRKKHSIIVVFDGGPYEWPFRDQEHGVSVVYSGRNETADDYIIQLLEEKRTHDLLLISSDRLLNSHASSFHIPSIDSDRFWFLVQEEANELPDVSKKKKTEIIKLTKSKNPELDSLMEQAVGILVHKSDDAIIQKERVVANKPSKKERKIKALLKKL